MPDTSIRARIDPDLKAEATAVLKGLGLSPSEAIRQFLHHVADEKCLPFRVKLPNDATRDAMREVAANQCRTCTSSVDGLFTELCTGDD